MFTAGISNNLIAAAKILAAPFWVLDGLILLGAGYLIWRHFGRDGQGPRR